MKKKVYIILFFILAIATFLRFWQLGVVPPSPNWDEVSLGYNALSIRDTGKDEYGKAYPYILRSYDDYKPALYTYFVIPSITTFGLNTFAVRFPSAFMGTITVLLTFYLVCLLFPKKITIHKKEIYSEYVGLISAFLLAISPWHIQFSRIAFESNVGVSLNVFGVVIFLLALKRFYLLPISAIIFASNIYMYQSDKVFTPLLVFVLVAVYIKDLLKIPKKYLFLAVLFGIVVAAPMGYSTVFDKQALARAQGVSIFSNQTEFLKESTAKLESSREDNNLLGVIFYNRRVEFSKGVIDGYLTHFDPIWLFISGDIARHHAPSMGLLYLWEIPFLLVGFYQLVFGSFSKRTKLFIIAWILITPIPASITSGVPHAVRTLNFLPTFQIIGALGIVASFVYLFSFKNKILKSLIILGIGIYVFIMLLNISYYLNQYFVQQNKLVSSEWQYGYKEAIEEVSKIQNKYSKIVVSNQPHLDQSYMFFLFYLNYPPQSYQEDAKNASGGFRENHKFGKYEFRPIVWDQETKDKSILFIGRPQDFPESVNPLKTIKFLNGTSAIILVEG